mmetsp:Transcript_13491/g.19345  ORF Transcript_13491/g.19345 Transcript_13491/m.19345 type:complete len:1495 (-) Transcript_13491:1094-5578(-)
MSSTVIGLPSISTAYQTLKGLADPLADKRAVEESKLKWEQLCLAALSYGTDYSVPTLRIHAKGSITTAHASEAQQRPKLKLKIRANKALSFFIDVIASFDADIAAYTKLEGQSQQGRDKTCKNQSYLQQIDPVRLILVDALWIVGQFLVPPDTTYSISSNDDTSTTKSNQSNKVITQNMDTSDLSNRNTSLVDTQVDQRPSLSLEEEEEMREDSMVAFTYIVQGLAGLKVDPMPVSASARSNASASLTPTLSPHLLQMLLDPYQLSKAAIVPHEQFIRKYRKYQTNILYRQRRFNLLIEESEGWAKILALLSSLPSENDSAIHVLEQLRGYIGAFDLDPNRLLSILVDVLELELDRTLDEILKETSTDVDGLVRQSTSQGGRIVGDKTLALLLKLINDFKVSALPHLLGFKFQNLSTSNSTLTPDDKTHKDIKEAEPLIEDAAASSTRLIQKLKPFYNLTAFLVAHKVVSLEELFPYFAPRADTMTSKVDDRDTSSNVSNQAVLSDVSAPLILREWTKAKQKEVAHDVRSWGLVSLNASNTNTTEVKTSDETSEKRYLQVDKEIPVLVLLESLLSFGAWDQFAVLLELCRFPPPLPLSFSPSQKQKLEATSTGKPSDVDVILLRPTIGKVLCEFLHFLLDPWCRSSSMSPPCLWSNAKVSATFTKLTEAAGQWPFKAERCKGFSVKCFNQFIPVTSAVKNLLGTKNEESRLIDYLFEPIMVLASSHEAVLDATLYLKICRLFQSLLERDFEEPPGSNLSQRAKTIFQHYLLPAQSLYPANPQLSFALWSCLKLLPYTIRYSLYDAWAQGPRNYRRGFGTPFPLERNAISKTALTGNGCMNCDKSLWAVRTEVMAGKETRSVLKRLAKETILEQSRRFAKVSCTSPIVAFSILIQQMQAYDNMIDLMVDSFRLCSDLSRDVLVWCLLQNLASFDGSKLDITTTQLLTSIETFTGTLYRTFPFLEVRGIFDWLLSRLVASGPVISATLAGLGVIRSLLTTAGGLEMVGGEGGAVSGQQLEGRAGSQLLRRETVSFGIVDRVNPVASTSLLGILLSPIGSLRGNNIGVALLIRLAQLRLKVLFDSNLQNKDVMQLGKTCDSIQTTQLLLLEFLSTPRDWKESEAEETIETYSSNIPSLEELLDRKVGYGIDAAAAFAIVRPCIRAALMAEEAILEKREQEEAELLERGESRHSGGRETEGAIGVPTLYKRWLPSAPEIRRVCQSLIPCRFQNSISCTLYCTFWSLDLFDLYVPKHRYTVEINRLNKEEERLKQKRVAASETLPFTPKDAAELHRVAKNAAKLKDDQLKQIDHCKFVKSKKFEADIDKFFSCRRHDRDENEMGDSINVDNNDGGNFESSAKAFLTICIFPRALSSPDAAFYCAHFVQRLHNMNTPRFHTLQFFDHLVNATIGALMYFTEEEAQNFGILIEALWSVVVDWRYEKSDKREAENAYEREVMSKVGQVCQSFGSSHFLNTLSLLLTRMCVLLYLLLARVLSG